MNRSFVLASWLLPLVGLFACSGDAPISAGSPSSPDASSDASTASTDGASPDASPGKDASAPDAQDAAPITPYRVFVSAGTHDGAFGVDARSTTLGADSFCTIEAAAGSKTKPFGARVWRGYLSVGNWKTVARVKGKGPWVRPDGSQLGDITADLDDRPRKLVNPPNMDQNGAFLAAGSRVWIGSFQLVRLSHPNCSYFTKTGDGALAENAGATVDPSNTAPDWAETYVQGYVRACQEQHHVYCVEDEP